MQFPPSDEDYDQFNMTDLDLTIYAIHTCSLFIAWFGVSLLLFPDDTKRLAWCISLLNSLIMSAAALVYTWRKMPVGFLTLTVYPLSIFHGRDNFSAMFCLVFGVANVVDLLVGLMFYRDRLSILSTFVHHPVFSFIAYYSITGRFAGYQLSPFTQGFMWMLMEEIPTFILALGSVFPSFRMDMTFGLTFFIFRILFHGYGTSYAILSKSDTPICAFLCMSMVFHVIWFYQWVVGYRKRMHKHSAGSAGANQIAPHKSTHNKTIRTTVVSSPNGNGASPLLAPGKSKRI